MNLSRIIQHWANFRPNATAIHFQGEDIGYAALWQCIEAATAGIARELKLQPGDRFAFLGYNDPAMLVQLFALARLGGILVPLNFRLAVPELQRVLEHSGAKWLLADIRFAKQAETLRAALPHLKLIGLHGVQPGWLDWNALAQASGSVHIHGDDAMPLMIVYTSGTTGQPKGAVHTQEAMIWNMVCSTQCHDFTESDHVLMSLPMFHVGGLCIQTLPVLHAGGRVTLHPRFDAGAWLGDVAMRKPDMSLLVPATARAVIEHPSWPRTDLSSLRAINMGSSVVPSSFIRAFHARGVPVLQVYGATETGPVSIYLRREDSQRKAGSTGKPAMHCEIRLVDVNGLDVARGEVGELWLRGKNLMQGYWKDPDNPSYRDGWFKTGDLAHIDAEGFYWIAGRSKDMIISGGENIYPAELENVLAESPDILEAAVVAKPDPRWGEVAVAVIVKKPGSALDEDSVKRMFEGRLARYKHPRGVMFTEALPKTALGKVRKAELAKQLAGAD